MILTDKTIKSLIQKGSIVVEPLVEKNIGTNSIDLTLSNKLLVYTSKPLDPRKPNPTEEIIIPEGGLVLEPHKLYLACTNEYTKTVNHVPVIEGKSSLARLGLFVHITAGFGDVGFEGRWTLELHCVEPIIVYPNMKICQIAYHSVSEQPENGYDTKVDAKYNKSLTVNASKMHLNFESDPNWLIDAYEERVTNNI